MELISLLIFVLPGFMAPVLWLTLGIKFAVKGYGHGIGMSQTGADSLASSGSNYEDIIHHFYIGVEIKDM